MNWENFTVVAAGDKDRVLHCRFLSLSTGIAPRHSDSVDVRFLVNGRPVIVALPHAAFAEYRRRTGRSLTDAQARQLAALLLKSVLEEGEVVGDALVSPTVEETLELARQISGGDVSLSR